MSPINAIEEKTVEDLRAMVKRDPHRAGRAHAKLTDAGVSVWAIILHITTFGGADDATEATPVQISHAADAYEIPELAVRAAVAYYAENRAPIDAWLALLSDE